MHIKKFEAFVNSTLGDSLIKKFDKISKSDEVPADPFLPSLKRDLTDDEREKMRKHFSNHSYSNYVDANGRIVLGGGEEFNGEHYGMYYITASDLEKLD